MEPMEQYLDDTDETGLLFDRYNIYLSCADDGRGNDITTGKPLLSFDEWLNN